MEAQQLVRIAQMRGEYYMAEWFADVMPDNKPAVPNGLCNIAQHTSLFARAARKYLPPRHTRRK